MEEVLHQGASAAEIAETLDIGVLMGGTLAIKSVRHAFAVMDALRADPTRKSSG
ncbi:MAG: hypothetical protein AAB265_12195 [candidate division NC10 bacterium]